MKISAKQRKSFLDVKIDIENRGFFDLADCIGKIRKGEDIPCIKFLVEKDFIKDKKDFPEFFLSKLNKITHSGVKNSSYSIENDLFSRIPCQYCIFACLLEEEKEEKEEKEKFKIAKEIGDCNNCNRGLSCKECSWQTQTIKIFQDKTLIGRKISPIFANQIDMFWRVHFIDCDISKIDYNNKRKFIECQFDIHCIV